jgi:nickel superoxide dismutase
MDITDNMDKVPACRSVVKSVVVSRVLAGRHGTIGGPGEGRRRAAAASIELQRSRPMDLSRLIAPRRVAHAHCDIPCGIYDPAQARIEAESCYRIIEKYHTSEDPLFRARCIHVKEERAELTKHHIDVMWHDYFKPEHVEKYPDLHDVCWKASKQASAVKRTLDIAEAQKLLDLIDRIDEMWKGTGGQSATRLPA